MPVKRYKTKTAAEIREPQEKVLWRGSPELAAFYGFYILGMLVWIASMVVAASWYFPLAAWAIVIIFSATMFILPHIFRKAWTFLITTRRIRTEFKLMGYRAFELPIENVARVFMSQGLFGRIFNFGEIRITTFDPYFPGIVLWGIRNPQTVMNIIEMNVLSSR